MGSRTRLEMVERAEWWRRKPWPVVVLGVDPAESSGWTIALPEEAPRGLGMAGGPYLWRCEQVNIYTRGVEEAVEAAANLAQQRGLKLMVCLEEWGSGGRLGIKTWLGMGAAAGAWKRAVLLAAREERHKEVLTVSRCLLGAPQSRWRSRMIEECGIQVGDSFRRYTPEEWKKAAGDAMREMFPYVKLEGADAAESGLIAAYAMRSDELGYMLPDTYLRKHGFEPLPVQPAKEKKARKPPRKKPVEVAT